MSTRVTSGSAFEREGQSRGGSGPSGRPAGGKVDRAGRPVKRDASRQAARENAMFNWHTRASVGRCDCGQNLFTPERQQNSREKEGQQRDEGQQREDEPTRAEGEPRAASRAASGQASRAEVSAERKVRGERREVSAEREGEPLVQCIKLGPPNRAWACWRETWHLTRI